ncbi:MAG: hypothetical protein IH577_04500 [Deltaproteobacteria bacterium]|nr:hypothetical protein [Deltaproteobacteria bacterium]
MPSPKTRGRMINRDISNSKGFAKLSPPAAVLFTMMIPHYSSHGKMNGGVGYIKEEVCPRVPYLTVSNISKYLKEISNHTSVKWFEYDGRHWIHSINFLSDHQTLNRERLGVDLLPSYSGVGPELVPPEVEGKGEGKGEGEGDRKRSVPRPENGRFTPPTLNDVSEYCKARGNSIDPIRWHAHYTANGWRVGKNKMQDWKAAVVTWERGNT